MRFKIPRKILILSLFVLTIGIIISISYNLTNPTKINRLIASKVYKGAANSYFKDQVLYNAVVDAYNSENKTSLPYTTNLTDEQLQTITRLSYSGYNKEDKITDASGMEKLTGLIYLYLGVNQLSNIDVSKNTKLSDLRLYNNQLTSIDLSKNTELIKLDLSSNELENIDVSDNTKLTSLELNHNQLTNIDVTKSTELSALHLYKNQLTSIDVSKNTELTALDLGYNQLTNIDVTKNTKLKNLGLSYSNRLTNIDVTKNAELKSLGLGENQLTSIDVSKNTKLTNLNLNYNKLTNIDVTKNTGLTILSLSSNKLTSIDVSKNTALTLLDLSSNKLTSIDVSKNTKLTNLSLNGNNFEIGKMYLKRGKSEIFNNPIKLPENNTEFTENYSISDNLIATIENNKIKGLKADNTNIDITYTKVGGDGLYDVKINGILSVYDITSSKYNINDEEKYIYTKMDIDNNTILSNIKLENIEGKIENNQLVLKDGDTVVDTYKLVNYTSSTYDLSKEYIYIGTNSLDKTKITCTNCTLEVSNNTLNIKYGNEVLKSYKLVSYESNDYDLSKEYIYIGTNSLDKTKITCTNCTLEVSNNTLNIKYGNEVLKSYKLVSYESNDYDLSKEYIYIGINSLDKTKITCTNCTLEVSNNTLNIKYGNEVLKSYKLVSYESNDYDLSKEYIYIGTNSLDKTKIICTNCTLEVSNNTLNIKYGSEVLKSYKLVSYKSDYYDLSKGYIKIGNGEEFDVTKVICNNCVASYENEKLIIKYNNEVLEEIPVGKSLFGDLTDDGAISLKDVTKLYNLVKEIKRGKTLTEKEILINDMNRDGKVSLSDVSKLYNYVKAVKKGQNVTL